MKIALDATYSVGSELSGVGNYCRQLLFGLAPAHPEAEFLFCYRPHRLLRSLPLRLPPNSHRRLLWEARPPRAANLFHGLNQRLPAAPLPRAVSTFHDLFVLSGEYSSEDFRRRFARQARHAAERSDLIIAVSEFTAGQLEDLLGVERSRIRVVPHGVSERSAPGCSPPARGKMILHVGAIQKRKNIARLVEAFERTPHGWKLVLAGSAGFGAEEILSRVRQSPRRSDIELLGYVSETRLAELYSRAAIFAFPSLDEGFGMPVLEAMAWGVPVVASNRSALPEVAADAALLVDPVDTEAIASGLRSLIDDRTLCQDLEARGRRRAAAFRWDQAVDRTWQVYRELTG